MAGFEASSHPITPEQAADTDWQIIEEAYRLSGSIHTKGLERYCKKVRKQMNRPLRQAVNDLCYPIESEKEVVTPSRHYDFAEPVWHGLVAGSQLASNLFTFPKYTEFAVRQRHALTLMRDVLRGSPIGIEDYMRVGGIVWGERLEAEGTMPQCSLEIEAEDELASFRDAFGYMATAAHVMILETVMEHNNSLSRSETRHMQRTADHIYHATELFPKDI